MKIELEKVSNGWVIRTILTDYEFGSATFMAIARNVPDCLAELSKIMDQK